MHDFKFKNGDLVVALDYSEPRQEHKGTVVRRWLEENPSYMDNVGLLERYDVLIQTPAGFQRCEFLVSDLRPR